MSETKTYVFPESGGSGGGNGMMAMLAPLLQQKGIDPNLLVAMQGKNNNGFGGDAMERLERWLYWLIPFVIIARVVSLCLSLVM